MSFEKFEMHTTNIVDENVQKIRDLFPNCVTETRNKEGNSEFQVDFELLKQELSDHVIDGSKERYQLTWPDKRKAILEANAPISKTLRPCKEKSVDWDTTKNIYIEGDNLDALKLLRETYLGKIKMIYIDPPYNTGNDFVYEDDFAESTDEYLKASGQMSEAGEKLNTNSESNGRFHTDWLNLMYPRLKLARDLLSDDGVIFISIDNHEIDNLRKISDELFGMGNFIGVLIIQTATDNNPSQINTEHEYMVCYAKNAIELPKWSKKSENAVKIEKEYETLKNKGLSIDKIQIELREWIKVHKNELKQVEHYNCVDEKGVYTANTNSSNTKPGGYTYDIIHPLTYKACTKPAFGWRWPEKTFWQYANAGEVEWGIDETTQPHIKKRIETAQEQLKTVIYEDGRASTKLLENLFQKKKIFENPKSETIIKRILDFASSKNAIILDFFSGSATTAHAVMQLNAEDQGNRKYIMVQLDEPCGEDSEAFKAGYKTICDIGEERIRRAGKKIKEENPLTTVDLDTGFRVYKVDTSNMKDVYYNPADIQQSELTGFADNVKEDRTGMDLLIQVMLEKGIELSSSIVEDTVSGKRIFNVAENHLIACFDNEINDDVITAIAKKQPNYVVLKDSGYIDDAVAVNFEQIFKKYSPDTDCMVI